MLYILKILVFNLNKIDFIILIRGKRKERAGKNSFTNIC